MAAIIKTQIVKHLSKFTKNLSPDKIQLSTLKGEGELTNLELNEEILMELMDLPTWLTLTKAVCNKVNIKMQWSKLKSQPIELYLDEVVVSMEMCEQLREPTNTSGLPSYSSGGRYGFGDRVVDGMYLQINAVIVNFSSKAFQANINLSRIIIQSKTPTWRTPVDLQHTRICEKQNDVMLTFKEVSWQTLKIEADCMVSDGIRQTTPLRLITNESKIRISVKKRYSDCAAVATRLQFMMDDLLWIVTDSQMKAAVVFAKHLKDNMDKSKEQSKRLAAQQIQKQRQAQKKPATTSQTSTHRASPVSSLFNKFDIAESSYHVQTCRVDLHICDDINDQKRNRLVDGGAIGIAIMKLQISHYPLRPAGQSRSNCSRYDESAADWTNALLKNYIHQLKQDKANGVTYEGIKDLPPEPVTKHLLERRTVLMVDDFFITSVSREKQEGNRPPKILMSDKKSLHLPPEMSAFHLENTEYFFDHNTSLPTPCPNTYIKINPIKLVLDTYTITWFYSFALSLAKDVDELLKALPIDTNKKKERMELRLEALMPKIVLPLVGSVPQFQHDRPDSLQMLISRAVITNNHVALPSNRNSMSAHKSLLQKYSRLFLSNSKHFPNQPSSDLTLLSPEHHEYSSSNCLTHLVNPSEQGDTAVPSEIYSVELEQFWMEFSGVKNSGNRPVSFLESFPITIWLTVPSAAKENVPDSNPSLSHQPLQRLSELAKDKKIVNQHNLKHLSVMIEIGAKICLQINHYQFCFLMRLADSFTDMMETMTKEQSLYKDLFATNSDQKDVLPTIDSSTVVLQLREVQVALLAKPGVNVSKIDTASDTDLTSEPAVDSTIDISSSLPTGNDVGSGIATDITISVSDVVDSPSADTSPYGSDSGIASVTPSFVSEESDIRQSTEGRAHKSAFYTPDTLLPPGAENNVGLKISSVFGKVTSKVKHSINKVMDEDNFDAMSITSGMSDDFDMLAELSGQEEEAAFTPKHTGGLNDDEHGSTMSIGLAERPKQMFSVTIFKLCGIEVGLQTQEDDMVAKVAVQALHNEDRGNIYYDDFQAQQLLDMCNYMSESGDEYPIKVRFSKGPAAADLATGAEEKGFAHIKVSDYSLSFLSSTVDKLGALFKDERVDIPLPLLIEVSNFDFELQDDALPAYNTESPSVPIALHVNKVSLVRSIDGIINVQGDTLLGESKSPLKVRKVSKSDKGSNTVPEDHVDTPVVKPAATRASSSAQLLEEMKYLQDENRALKEQILRLNERLIEKDHVEFERGESTNSTAEQHFELHKDLEFYKKETRILRSQVMADGDQIDSLQAAKECLLETVRLLKNELDSKPQY